MKRLILAAAACLVAVPALALDTPPSGKPATLGNRTPYGGAPGTYNEDGFKKAQAQQEAKFKVWDAQMKRTMSGVCKGC